MNEKEFNLAILKELRKIAGKVFAKVTVSKEGTYTAAELWNEKDAFGESIVIDYKGTESEIYTAEIGTFKMQVTPQKLWYVLWKFEKLCNVRQADKIRFTYGEAEHEIVNEKAMYYTGSMERGSYNHKTGCCEITGNGNYKIVTRKKSLKKLSNNVAEDKKGMLYYKVVDVWYIISDRPLPENITDRIKNEPDYIFGLLSKFDFSVKCELNPILNALYEAMKSERENSKPEQRKYGNAATSYERFQDRTICGRFQKNMRPNYLRQKVFPTESFQSIRNISRFKPRNFVRSTNHYIYEENSLERKRNGNTSVYRILIRGETEICNW